MSGRVLLRFPYLAPKRPEINRNMAQCVRKIRDGRLAGVNEDRIFLPIWQD